LHEDLFAIFQAGLDAARSDGLVEDALRRDGRFL
jgi:hypothetical protein